MQKERQASMTVEASFVLPIFLFAMLQIAFLGQLVRVQDEVQWALTRTAREAAAEYGAAEQELMKHKGYYHAKLEKNLKGSGAAISLIESHILEKNDEIDIVALYEVRCPFFIGTDRICRFRQRVHTRAFTGVKSREGTEAEKNVTVYVTTHGTVYHRNRDCTYLKLSISQILYGDLENVRNGSGGIYKQCEKCSQNKTFRNNEKVWIANYGDRYHSSRSCSGIKRTIKQINLTEVGKRTPCSKCGGNNEDD